MLRKICALLWLGMMLTICFAEADKRDPALLFEVNFDSFTANAAFARGNGQCRGLGNTDLQMRMFPGVKGTGNAINLENSESCTFDMKGNFTPAQGTISMWIAPQNWKPSENKCQIFLDAIDPKFRMIVYKFNYPGCFYFYLQYDAAACPTKVFTAVAFQDDKEWESGKWHRLDAVWNSDGLQLFVDGQLPKPVEWRKPVLKFPTKIELPAPSASGKITIGTGQEWKGNPMIDLRHKTAFDMVHIYDRCLSPAEIREEYEKVFPPVSTQQVNRLTIPRTPSEPVIDGKVAAGEYEDATSVPLNELLGSSPMRRLAANGRAWLKYDDKNLYVAVISDHKPEIRRKVNRDDKLWEDESVELILRKKAPGAPMFHFIINANGTVYDAKDTNASWNSRIRAVAQHGSDGWTLECAIPLEDFGGITPGEWFEGNVYLTSLEASPCYQGWNGGPSGQYVDNLGLFRFGTDATAIRLNDVGNLPNGKLSLSLNSTVSGLNASAEIDRGNGEFIRCPSNPLENSWSATLPSGKQTLNVTVKNSSGEEVFSYHKQYYVDFPLEIAFDCWPYRGYIEVKYNLNNAGAEVRNEIAGGKLKCFAQLRRDGKTVTSVDFTPSKPLDSCRLPLPNPLVEGKYEIFVQTGKLQHSIPFQIPDQRPYQLKIADDHSIPKPFSPIEDRGNRTYRVSGREYRFADSPAPLQASSRGHALLTKSPEWKVDGKPVVWSDFTVTESHPDVIRFTGTGLADGLKFRWQGELGFDGVYILKWDMTPAASSRSISSLTLDYAVTREFARYVLSPLLDPWKNGQISKIFQITNPNINRDFLIWTTGYEEGFVWWPKSLANWVNADGKEQVVLKQEKDTVTVHIDIISQTSQLARTAEYTMAFMATPAKPQPTGWRDFNFLGWYKTPGQNAQIALNTNCFEPKRSPGDAVSPVTHIPSDWNSFARITATNRKKGIRPYIYLMPAQLSSVEPEYEFYLKSWEKVPTYLHQIIKEGRKIICEPCCGHTRIADLHAMQIDEFFRRLPDLEGIYYDLSDIRFCMNQEHGCGGVDAFGKPYMSSIALNLRSYLIRVRRLASKYDKTLIIHAHSLFNPLAHSQGDYWYPGEQYYAPLATNPEYFYTEGITLEEFQSELNSTIKGTGLVLCPQYGRSSHPRYGIESLKKRHKEFYFDPEYAIRTMTPMLLHDVPVAAEMMSWPTVGKWWEIKKPLNLPEAVFHGYWRNNAVQSSTEGIKASWYELKTPAKYKRLIVVSNLSREAKPAGLSINRKEFGGANKEWTSRELWNDQSMTENDLKTLSIPGAHFALIAVDWK